MSDLMFPVFVFSRIITQIQTNSWIIGGCPGQVLCKLVSFLSEVSVAVSIQSLVLIAVDRFVAVVYPLRSPVVSSKRCPFFILATWILAMAIKFPYLIAFELVEYPSARIECEPHWEKVFGHTSNFTDYVLANIITLYYMPLVLIAVLYIIIVFKLKLQVVPGSAQSVTAEQQRFKIERNVLKMSTSIVLMFAICQLPATIYYLLYFFSRDLTVRHSCGFAHFHSIAVLLARSYAAVNPFIYFVFSGNYRQGLKNLLGCFSVKLREPPNNGKRTIRDTNEYETGLWKSRRWRRWRRRERLNKKETGRRWKIWPK